MEMEPAVIGVVGSHGAFRKLREYSKDDNGADVAAARTIVCILSSLMLRASHTGLTKATARSARSSIARKFTTARAHYGEPERLRRRERPSAHQAAPPTGTKCNRSAAECTGSRQVVDDILDADNTSLERRVWSNSDLPRERRSDRGDELFDLGLVQPDRQLQASS